MYISHANELNLKLHMCTSYHCAARLFTVNIICALYIIAKTLCIVEDGLQTGVL